MADPASNERMISARIQPQERASTTTTTVTVNQACTFLDSLPREICDEIYRHKSVQPATDLLWADSINRQYQGREVQTWVFYGWQVSSEVSQGPTCRHHQSNAADDGVQAHFRRSCPHLLWRGCLYTWVDDVATCDCMRCTIKAGERDNEGKESGGWVCPALWLKNVAARRNWTRMKR